MSESDIDLLRKTHALGWELATSYPEQRAILDGRSLGLPILLNRWRGFEGRIRILADRKQSEIADLDVDQKPGKADGVAECERLESELGPLPRAPLYKSPSGGGYHILFKRPDGRVNKNLAPGVELIINSFAVLPPTTGYKWIIPPWNFETNWAGQPELPELPKAWQEYCYKPSIISRGESGLDSSIDTDVTPYDYFEVLCGIEIPENGMVNCPLPSHGDSVASCKVFDSGWYCFACDLGGSIYDLESLLNGGPSGAELRGNDFTMTRVNVKEKMRRGRLDER